jgi:hypothetical protein
MKRLLVLAVLLLPTLSGAATRISQPFKVGTSTHSIVTQWLSYTPPDARWVDANHTHTGFYRRVGGQLEVRIKTALTGAPTTANYAVRLPVGLTIDTSKLINAAQPETDTLGTAIIKAAGTNYFGNVVYDSVEGTANALSVQALAASGSYTNTAQVTQAVPGTFANGDWVLIRASVPITGW